MPPRDKVLGNGFAATRKAIGELLKEADQDIANALTEITMTELTKPTPPPAPKKKKQPDAPRHRDLYPNSTVAPSTYLSTSSMPSIYFNPGSGLCSTASAYSPGGFSVPTTPYGKIKSKCGHTIDAGDNFCRQCGKRAMKVDE